MNRVAQTFVQPKMIDFTSHPVGWKVFLRFDERSCSNEARYELNLGIEVPPHREDFVERRPMRPK